MELPKLHGKTLLSIKVLYSLPFVAVFGFISLYWLIGVVTSPYFFYGLAIQQDLKALIPIGLVLVGGFSLIGFIILNHKVLIDKTPLSDISNVFHTATILGCMISFTAVPYYGIGLIPVALVACLYYLAYHNTSSGYSKPMKTTLVSQKAQSQEQV